ncbi:MAG: flagellar biosynthetic protein FliO [Phycisphaeraceae bacterium]
MSRLRFNPGAGRMLVLWIVMAAAPIGAACLLLCTSSVFAQSDGSIPPAPVLPTGPNAGSVPVGPRGPVESIDSPASPKSPNDPREVSAEKGGTGDRRMVDLAKRLATGEVDADQTGEGEGRSTGRAATGSATRPSAEAENRAAASNQMKLADPDEQRPLSARVKHNDGKLPGSPQTDVASGSWVLNGITALGIVLILIFLLRGALRKAGVGGAIGPHPAVQVLSRVSVAPRNHVLLIRVGQRVLVVGDSAAGLRTLASIDEPEEVAEIITSAATAKSDSITGGFRKMLQGFSGMYGSGGEKEIGTDEDEYQVDRARDGVAGLVGRLRNGGGEGGGA